MRASLRSQALDFVDSIPDDRLLGGFPTRSGACIYSTSDFRLDMQTLTTGDSKFWNIQVQANKKAQSKQVRASAKPSNTHAGGGGTFGKAFVPCGDPWAPKDLINGYGDSSGQY